MNHINFLFGIHNHQPIGNFDFVFEETYEKAYLPFAEVLEKFPSVKIAIHFSGILLDWIISKRPGYVDIIRKMVQRGQLEILTGGYYEPILCVIPDQDRLGQIRKLNKKIHEVFGYSAEGLWLAERVWEPTLPATLSDAGVKYTIIDDTHFKYAGLKDNQLAGFYSTEELGKSIDLFPISRRLRYAIPFEDPDVTIAYLRSMASEDGRNIIVFADDGEKFGAWPNTWDHVYNQRWLERFFQSLQDNKDWIRMLHFGEARKVFDPLGRIYLPTASYSEMMQWALFPDAFKSYGEFEKYLKANGLYEDMHVFVRGGFWRNFMAKYPEIDHMHKKMLLISEKLQKLPATKKKKLEKAFDQLWAAQCNCPYWHGVFGGFYLSHLRDAIYENLIKAESLIDQELGQKYPAFGTNQTNLNGQDDIKVKTEFYNTQIDLKTGGMLNELDFKPVAKNILDTVTRRREGYHDKLADAVVPGAASDGQETASIHDLVQAKEPGLMSHLHYDFYERKSYLDHFLEENTSLETFSFSQYTESGDFLSGPYTLVSKKSLKNSLQLELERIGSVICRGQKESVGITKKYIFRNKESSIETEYSLKNHSGRLLDLWFGVEFNFGLQAGHADDRFYYIHNGSLDDRYLDSRGSLDGVAFIGLTDQWRKLDIQMTFDKQATIWRFPIETISLSEGGFEKVYQSSVVFPNWKISLKDSWHIKIIQKIRKLDLP